MADPSGGIDVGAFSFHICRTDSATFEPCLADGPEGRKIVLAILHERQVGDERDVDAETRESFNEASQPLRRRIENPVHTHRVVEPVSEGSVFLGTGPVRNRPGVVIPTDTEKRPRRPLRFKIHSIHS